MNLTAPQKSVLQAYRRYWRAHGFAPNLREIAPALRISYQRVWQVCKQLQALGLLEHSGAATRAYRPSGGKP